MADDEPWVVRSLVKVAEFFHRSHSTVKKEWRATGIVIGKRPYNLSEIFLRLEESWKRRQSEEGLREQKLRIQRLEEDVRERRRENAAKEGKLLDVNAVERETTQWAARLRMQLEHIPTTCSNIVPTAMKAAVKQAVQSQVDQMLRDAWNEQIGDKTLEDMILDEADRIRKARGDGE
jgi:hypothetical protein